MELKLLVVGTVTTILLIFVLIWIMNARVNGYTGKICCIMITGKDDARIDLARKALDNFVKQEYPDKMLLIINHNPHKQVIDQNVKDVHEFYIEKKGNLGDLRNIALQFIPLGCCWTTWDDDDYRHPSYLQTLARFKTDNNIVCLSRRLEYNSNNGASWVGYKKDGFVFFLAPVDNRIIYLSRDTMEDVDILDDFRKNGYTVKVLKNDPKIYVRVVHSSNTSLYVNAQRNYLVKGPTYSERFTTPKEQEYIRTIIPKVI